MGVKASCTDHHLYYIPH